MTGAILKHSFRFYQNCIFNYQEPNLKIMGFGFGKNHTGQNSPFLSSCDCTSKLQGSKL